MLRCQALLTYLNDVDYQNTEGDDHDASHPFVIPSFENHTIGIGSRLLSKMGYVGGGLEKNEQGIVTPINPIVQTSIAGLGYDHVVASSPTSNCEVLEENAPNKHIDDIASSFIPDEKLVAPDFESEN